VRSSWLVLVGAVCWGGCAAPGSPDTAAGVQTSALESAARLTALPLRTVAPAVTGVLVFHSDLEGRDKLFTIDLATREVRRLTQGSDHRDEQGVWSPDGLTLAFVTTRFDHRTYELALMDARHSVARVTSSIAMEQDPAWAADGRSVFLTSDRDGTQAVYRVWLGSGQADRVSSPPNRGLMPSASPDGTRLAYTAGTTEGLRLVVHDLRSGFTSAVSPPGGAIADARWSPDGRRLAYSRFQPNGASIEVLTLDTGVAEVYGVEGLASLRQPCWSPDGQYLAASGRGGAVDWDLFLIHPEAGEAFRLTSGSGNDRSPSWRPR
jgi:TolB protein